MTAETWLLPALLLVPLVGCGLAAVLPGGERVAAWFAVVVSAVTLGIAVAAALAVDRDRWSTAQLEVDLSWVPALDLRLHLGVDGISVPLVLLTALLVLCCAVFLLHGFPTGGRPRGLVSLLLLLETGMLATFVALDLLLFFLAFEVVLVPMWFLVARWGDEHDVAGRVRAANVFILYTLVGSGVMLLGILLVHAQTGTFDMVALAAAGGAGMTTSVETLAALALVGGLAVKAPMWPLHTWLPDAHAKAPTVGSVLLAGVLLKMGTYGLVRVAVPIVPEGVRVLAPWLAGLAVVGVVYAGLACLAQTDLKRLIAYSSVGHMGFVLLGIASLSTVGINGALYANVAHGLITGLLFFLAGAIKERHGGGSFVVIGRGLYGRAPRLGGLLVFGAVASLGLPGLAGFWGELLALVGAFRPGLGLERPLFLVLMVVAGLGTVLAAVYLLTTVRRVCHGAPDGQPAVPDLAAAEAVAWAPLVALTVLLGLWPGLLLGVLDPAVAELVALGPGAR